jgi:hypothetical protein
VERIAAVLGDEDRVAVAERDVVERGVRRVTEAWSASIPWPLAFGTSPRPPEVAHDERTARRSLYSCRAVVAMSLGTVS